MHPTPLGLTHFFKTPGPTVISDVGVDAVRNEGCDILRKNQANRCRQVAGCRGDAPMWGSEFPTLGGLTRGEIGYLTFCWFQLSSVPQLSSRRLELRDDAPVTSDE